MRSRYQEWHTISGLVPAIWLIFYAIAIVGAVAWPRQVAEEMATVVPDTYQSEVQ